jgi:hypothetical protein
MLVSRRYTAASSVVGAASVTQSALGCQDMMFFPALHRISGQNDKCVQNDFAPHLFSQWQST